LATPRHRAVIALSSLIASSCATAQTASGPINEPGPAAVRQGVAIGTSSGELLDATRDRRVGYRAYFPIGAPEETLRLILVSHGGTGSLTGENRGEHLGIAFADAGYVAIHLGHRPATATRNLTDRPADVSFVLDALAQGRVALPVGYLARLDLNEVGHVGHSYGAYTAHAVGGATFDQGRFRDRRIAAIVALSPQGLDQFGAFDEGKGVNTWATVEVPVYSMYGALEEDGNAIGVFKADRWRAQPFERYPLIVDSVQSVLPGADHNDLWSSGSPEVERFIAGNALAFFAVYLLGDRTGRDQIGSAPPLEGVATTPKSADLNNDGLLGVADAALFAPAFEAARPEADVAPPFGIVDLNDADGFLNAVNGG